MPKHVMIDIETWGKGRDALIISIGAVKFDPLKPASEFDNFHVAIDPRFSKGQGFEIDPDTVLYWMAHKQRPALDFWLSCEKIDLATALWGFVNWFGDESLPTWGNGATFDNVIMLAAIEKLGMVRPWTYKDDRCYRTLAALFPEVRKPSHDDMREMVAATSGEGLEVGVIAHTALYDAQVQAVHMQRIFGELRGLQHLAALRGDAGVSNVDHAAGTITRDLKDGYPPLHQKLPAAEVPSRPEPKPTMAQMLQDMDDPARSSIEPLDFDPSKD